MTVSEQNFKICTEEDKLGIQNLEVYEDNSEISVAVELLPGVNVSGGTLEVVVTKSDLIDIVVFDEAYETCEVINCPIIANQNASLLYSVPTDITLPGNYEVKMKAYDEIGEKLTCVEFGIKL